MAVSGGQRMTRGARHAFLVLAGALVLMVAALPTFTVVYANSTARVQDGTIAQLRTQLLAACGFAADIGTAPIPDRPVPGRLGIKIVTDSRGQWHALHCPGSLPVPPGLAKWAAHYHIPVEGK